MNTTITLARKEAARAREAAWERYQDSCRNRDSWSRVIAERAARGELPTDDTAAELIIARAVAFEGRADWREAHDRRLAVTA